MRKILKQVTIQLNLLLFLNLLFNISCPAQDITSFLEKEQEEKERINLQYYSILKDTLNYSSDLRVPKSREIDTVIFYRFTEFEKKTRHFKYLHTMKDVIDIIDNWIEVGRYKWHQSYSHVALNDSYGVI